MLLLARFIARISATFFLEFLQGEYVKEKTVNIIKDNLTSTLRQRRVKRLAQRIKETNMAHKHDYVFSRHCGANICYWCDDHQGLARCYCGWATDGGNGRDQLRDLGENLEDV